MSCIRTALLQSYVNHATGDADARQLASALKVVDLLPNRLRATPVTMLYPKLQATAPGLAWVMSPYTMASDGGLNAMYC